jgi:hypothetical protein
MHYSSAGFKKVKNIIDTLEILNTDQKNKINLKSETEEVQPSLTQEETIDKE